MINEPNSFEVVNEDSLNDFGLRGFKGDAAEITMVYADGGNKDGGYISVFIIGRITNLSGI